MRNQGEVKMETPSVTGAKENAGKTHPLDPDDAPISAAIRAASRVAKGVPPGPGTRQQYDALMQSVAQRDGVTFETDTVGGIKGVWVLPPDGRPDEAILHLHGGWFNFGSAQAYRNFVGHIAAGAGARAFIPDYRLAPEHPFPAATEDALASYEGLAKMNVHRVAITGDSAGGNLALGLASRVASGGVPGGPALAAVAVMSPVTDLTLSSPSYESRADADPLFTRSQVAGLVRSYLGNADPMNPLASPLHGRLAGMPPVCIHVGDDEVLLDDSRRYIDRAIGAGVDVKLDVWIGMPHGFVINVGRLKAASLALNDMGAFLSERLRARPKR